MVTIVRDKHHNICSTKAVRHHSPVKAARNQNDNVRSEKLCGKKRFFFCRKGGDSANLFILLNLKAYLA